MQAVFYFENCKNRKETSSITLRFLCLIVDMIITRPRWWWWFCWCTGLHSWTSREGFAPIMSSSVGLSENNQILCGDFVFSSCVSFIQTGTMLQIQIYWCCCMYGCHHIVNLCHWSMLMVQFYLQRCYGYGPILNQLLVVQFYLQRNILWLRWVDPDSLQGP